METRRGLKHWHEQVQEIGKNIQKLVKLHFVALFERRFSKVLSNYFERDLVKWLRGRVTVISSFVMPAAWLVFVGLALPAKFTDNYLAFITPGILVITTFFSSLQGGSLMIFDKLLVF